MPITGDQKALMHARLNVMRLGASRLGYYAPTLAISIGGYPLSKVLRVAGLQITDYLDGQPNIATMRVWWTTPEVGHEVKIGLGSLDPAQLVFAGRIQHRVQVYEGDTPKHIAWDLTCISGEWLLNRRLITKRYVGMSASSIVIDIIQTYTQGYYTYQVEPDLPWIDEFTLTQSTVTAALDLLAKRIGAYWFVDYGNDVNFFITPRDAVSTIYHWEPHTAAAITHGIDLDPVKTRVYVTGGGSRTTVPISSGDVTMPIEDATLFSATGGMAVHDVQRFFYGGKVNGGPASNVGGSLVGPAAPSAELAAGVGGILGTVKYRVSLRTSKGETIPGAESGPVTANRLGPPSNIGQYEVLTMGSGPLAGTYEYASTYTTRNDGETLLSGSATVSVPALAAPDAPLPSVLNVSGKLIGTFRYALTFVTKYGETQLGAWSGSVTVPPCPNPTTLGAVPAGAGPLVGTYQYAVAFVTPQGESLIGGTISRICQAVITPQGSPGLQEVPAVIGVLIGTFFYRATFVTALGETLVGPPNGISLNAQPAPSSPSYSPHSSEPGPLLGSYSYLTSFVDGTGRETVGNGGGFISCNARQPNTPSVSGSGTGQTIAYCVTWVHPIYGESPLSGRAIDSDKGLNPQVQCFDAPNGCGWNVYSTGTVPAGNGGSSPLYKVAEMPIGSTTFTHTNQTGPSEGVRESLGRAVLVSNVPTGPSGTIARRVYRTKQGGGAYYLVGQIDGNGSGGSFLDRVADDALTVVAPAQTQHGRQVQVVSLPTGPADVTLARNVYRTKSGGSSNGPFYLVGQVSGNGSSVSLVDNTPDSALTTAPPLVATAGGEATQLTAPVGPTGVTSRRLYRTKANGNTFFALADLDNAGSSSFYDAVPDSGLTGKAPEVTSSAGGLQARVTLPLSPVYAMPDGHTFITGRRLYRTKGTESNGPNFYLVATFNDPDYYYFPTPDPETEFEDNVADEDLREVCANYYEAGGGAVRWHLNNGPDGVTGRKLYRTRLDDFYGRFFYVGHVSGNDQLWDEDSEYTDDTPDEGLSVLSPIDNTAGGGRVRVFNLPVGPVGVTARRLYRTKGGGVEYFYVGQIANNDPGVEYLDDAADEELQDAAPLTAQVGALAGDASLPLQGVTGFPSAGWVRVDSMILRYTGISGTTLTGIPATGLGAIVAAIAADSAVVVEPHLTGVTGLIAALPLGETINLFVQVDDTDAQARMAALVGGDGIHEEHINDARLSQTEALARGQAKIWELRDPIETLRYTTRDKTTRAGRTVTISLGPPTLISGTFLIQQVTMTQFDPLNRLFPLCAVVASSRRESFDALLRILKRQAV
jgi:hypothetical protein